MSGYKNNLKKMVPLVSLDEVIPLIKAGADAFFCSIRIKFPDNLRNELMPISRREMPIANFDSMVELKKTIKIIHNNKKKVFFAANQHSYLPNQYAVILKYINKIIEYGIDGIIIADLGLIMRIRKINSSIPLIASVGCHILNSNTVQFYENFGIKQIILPRQLTLPEIKNIVTTFKNIKFECFVNESCTNLEGLCEYAHGIFTDFSPACAYLYDFQFFAEERKSVVRERLKYLYSTQALRTKLTCGACAVYDLNRFGVSYLKILGRETLLAKRIKHVEFMSDIINNLNRFADREKFIKYVKKKYETHYLKKCSNFCHYSVK